MRKHNFYRKQSHHTSASLHIVFCATVAVIVCSYHKLSPIEHLPLILFLLALMMPLPLIVRLIRKWMRKRRYLNSTLYAIDHMSGIEFEEFLKAHFEKQGYTVKLTKKSNDFGIDLICRRKTDSFVVQAKRYKGKVGISAVQQVIGGMKFYDCDAGIVITNNFFTKNAWELAKKSGVRLWDRNALEQNFQIAPKKKKEYRSQNNKTTSR